MAKTGKKRKPQSQIREPSAEYVRTKEIPAFFGQPMLKGSYVQIDIGRLVT